MSYKTRVQQISLDLKAPLHGSTNRSKMNYVNTQSLTNVFRDVASFQVTWKGWKRPLAWQEHLSRDKNTTNRKGLEALQQQALEVD